MSNDQALPHKTVQPEFRREEYITSGDVVAVFVTTVIFLAVVYVSASLYRKYYLRQPKKSVSQRVKVLETRILPTGEKISLLECLGKPVIVASNRAGIALLPLACGTDDDTCHAAPNLVGDEGKTF